MKNFCLFFLLISIVLLFSCNDAERLKQQEKQGEEFSNLMLEKLVSRMKTVDQALCLYYADCLDLTEKCGEYERLDSFFEEDESKSVVLKNEIILFIDSMKAKSNDINLESIQKKDNVFYDAFRDSVRGLSYLKDSLLFNDDELRELALNRVNSMENCYSDEILQEVLSELSTKNSN